jgi:8-oxo-dGTP pyrophosphatase MutT (NUDIX family)
MTIKEQAAIASESFDTLWKALWNDDRTSTDYVTSKEKFNSLDRFQLMATNLSVYTEPEWGFPKGRRMRGETDIACAIREFGEETNVPREAYSVLKNIMLEETFVGLNGVPYRHVYYVALLKRPEIIDLKQKFTPMQRREISGIGWKSFAEADGLIRPHHIERRSMLTQLRDVIETFEAE